MASSITAATTLYKPVLARPSEWTAWYTTLKKVAGDRDLGGAVDINNDNWTPLTKMQAWPSFEARQLLDNKAYKEQRALIREVREWIRTSTAATYANLAEPEDATLKIIVKKLHTLKPGKSLSPAKWLLQWQEAYSEAVRLDIDEIKGTLVLKDFIRAAGSYDTNWKSTIMIKTVEAEISGTTQQDLPYYANMFRVTCVAQSGKNSNNSAFATTATFNGKPEGDRPTYTCLIDLTLLSISQRSAGPCRRSSRGRKTGSIPPREGWCKGLWDKSVKSGRGNKARASPGPPGGPPPTLISTGHLDYAREELKKPEWKDLVQKIKSSAGDEEIWPKNSVAVVVSTVNAINYGPHALSRSIIFDTALPSTWSTPRLH
ncbi:hypothetical protein B0T24DRAFT_670433 [Lasiosphaeria ovina]|uniref:Uncharacterized protein n=1 Tax=Lasiosphaeria ovina TaxID=92902 RepID=A0AAE0MZ94_9PEZI|nr:hypothetical protein B0T24DRAFT_670433 [Lasiosphaeria ovina]